MKRLRILLADDHSQVLTLLTKVLEPTFHVVGTAEDGHALIAAAQALHPDIVLTDVDMPALNGIEATRELRKVQPRCRVICHSAQDDPNVMAAAFAAGASGFVIKGSTSHLMSSIQSVIRHVWKSGDHPDANSRPPHHVSHEPAGADRPLLTSL